MELRPMSPPLRVDEAGAVRVGESNVLLDVVLYDFHQGMSPAEIVEDLPTLTLPDVYGAIFYYLTEPDVVKTYLARREAGAAAMRKLAEERLKPSPEVRQRIEEARRSLQAS